MKFQFANNDSCAAATGVVVVIDVVRAFTTAAFALAAGAQRILLVSEVDQALALRGRIPGALVMGEVGGLLAEGFDLWNSPAQFAGLDISGKTIVQRTSAGTQGIVRSVNAGHLFAASFVVAGATARAVQALDPPEVTFVITGEHPKHPSWGREDRACADYIAALLAGHAPDPRGYLTWTGAFIEEHLANVPADIRAAFQADLDLCTQVDRFPFTLRVDRRDGLFVMEKTDVHSS